MNPAPRILLFTGDGKGKTTTALGIAIRGCANIINCPIIGLTNGAGYACMQLLFFDSQFLQAWKAYGSPLKSDAVAPL